MNSMLYYIDGDATQPVPLNSSAKIYLPHCCNDKGGWGSGFVNAITKKFGHNPRAIYKEWFSGKKASEINESFKDVDIKVLTQTKFELGGLQLIKVTDNINLVNMIGQHSYGSGQHVSISNNNKLDNVYRPPIRYGALVESMKYLMDIIQNNHMMSGAESLFEIHAPRFGSDLAGGDWKVIEQLILDLWVDKGANVVIYNWTAPKV